jgi:hypothetical protein
MKKLFLIRYTYNNIHKPAEAKHYDDNYYLCNNLAEALTDIQKKFNHGVEVNITQYEEIFYREL